MKYARSLITTARTAWERLSLSLQFAIAASVVVVVGMTVIGNWVSARIEEGVVNNVAIAEGVYVENHVAPHLQELAHASDLGEEHKLALDRLLTPMAASKPILSFRIWKENIVVHGDRKEQIGQAFAQTPALARAWRGATVVEFDHLSDEHSAGHPMQGTPVLEIYAPVRERGSGRIIAIAEINELASKLRQELTDAQLQSWFLVGAVTLVIIGCLFGIVHNGSRTIQRQRLSLEQRVAQLSLLLAENTDLRQRVDYANQRMADANERLLRRIGSDLHDGPVQLLGLALLKLQDLCDAVEETDKEILTRVDSAEVLRVALTETLREIRNLSAGLAPPDVENLSIRDTLQMAAQKHEQRTGTRVECDVNGLNVTVPFPIKTCLYRFAQEGLNNAYSHAGGAGQALLATCYHDVIEIGVKDQGPGMLVEQALTNTGCQGLIGLRFRVESLGGTFQVDSRLGSGTSLFARFPLSRHETVT
jgi:signal transduction histidine kinase